MNRREMLAGASVIALSAAAYAAPASDNKPKAPAAHHHDHPYGALAAAAADCLNQGDACLDHCLSLLAGGDTSLARCATSVRDMLATCAALRTLASSGSAQVKLMARVAVEVAKACQAECDKHTQHDPCKACSAACGRLIQQAAQLPA